MKYLFMFLIVIALAIPKVIHKNSKNISTENVNFQDKLLIKKTEDGICHASSTDDDKIKKFVPYSSLENCIKDGGVIVNPNISKFE